MAFMDAQPDEAVVIRALRDAGAAFAFVHGSRVDGSARPGSDLDVAAWWRTRAPSAWEVDVPAGVDVVVLNQAPLWLAGRISLDGRLLFDDNPTDRVAWQATTRRVWLDERPRILESQREFRQAVATHGR